MKYYDEEKMRSLRLSLESEILTWPQVTTKKMYGCPCYKYQDKLFAFLVTDGVVLTKVNDQDKTALVKVMDTKPFQAATRTMKNWPQLPLHTTNDRNAVLAFIKKSYQHATEESFPTDRPLKTPRRSSMK